MNKIDLKGIKNLEIKNLLIRIKAEKVDLEKLFMARSEAGKGSKDIKVVYKKRKDIAQMMTILGQKEMLSEIESSVISLQSSDKESAKIMKQKKSIKRKEKSDS